MDGYKSYIRNGDYMASYLDETGLLKLWNKIKNYMSNHTGNKNNPHGVTKSQVGLGSVENKSSATIRGEITASNVNTALGYTAAKQTDANKAITGISASGTTLVLTQLDGTTKYVTAELVKGQMIYCCSNSEDQIYCC